MARRVGSTRTDLRVFPQGPSLTEAWVEVQAIWVEEAGLSPQSIGRFTEIGDRFVARLSKEGITSWSEVDQAACSAFIGARTRSGTDPRAATQHTRRTTLRAMFRVLRASGLVDGDPTIDVAMPRRTAGAYRPLSDAEVELGRVASRLGGGSRTLIRAVAWALAEAGAATSEMGSVRVSDLDDPLAPARVRIPESRRFAAHVGMLTDWGSVLVARHVAALTGPVRDLPLAYVPPGNGGRFRPQAVMCKDLTRVLELAGLTADAAVRPRSVRGWAGRSRYDAGMPIEKVAEFLGYRSLDGAAGEIGLSWPRDPAPRLEGS